LILRRLAARSRKAAGDAFACKVEHPEKVEEAIHDSREADPTASVYVDILKSWRTGDETATRDRQRQSA
jgi:hypothetical protein